MPEAENTAKTIQLPAFPENSHVRIHVEQPREQREMSSRTLGTIISGAVGGFLGLFGGHMYARNKLIEFDSAVSDLTRADIMRGGTGAGLGSMGAEAGGIMNAGAALGGGIIEEKHRLDLIRSGKHKFAKFLRVIGGEGSFALGTAVVAAGAAAAAYLAFSRKNDSGHSVTNEPATAPQLVDPSAESVATATTLAVLEKDWKSRVAVDKEQPRTVA
jgi:hypothetical protein